MFQFNLQKQLTHDFNISVAFIAKPGEIITITGKSGAGKTTILKLIIGLLPLDDGFIKQANQDFTTMPMYLRKFGYIGQESLLFPHLNVWENLTYSGTTDKLDEYIDIFELRPHLKKQPHQLSGGEAQRVSIVRTLASNPQLLLLDEPTSALNYTLKAKIHHYLKQNLNIPTILVTHDLQEAAQLSDKVILIDQGKMIDQGSFRKILPQVTPKDPVSSCLLSTAILTGGKSTRMGKNKAFLTHNNQPFIDLLLKELTPFGKPFISAYDLTPYQSYPNLVQDEISDIGPLSGLYTCLKHCEHDHLFICGVDMPKLKKELIDFMLTYISPEFDGYVIQTAAKTHPLCGIYHKRIQPVIKQMIEEKNYRLMELLNRLHIKYIPLQYSCFSEDVVSNINTPADFNALTKPPIICVSGLKNTGKTTLITKLISAFKVEGYRVGVIKHDGHEFEIDVENTDTFKYRKAGSDGALIYSDTKFALVKKLSIPEIDSFIDHFDDMDLIIIEGLKHSSYPKIEVVREHSVCDERYLLAIATDSDFKHERVQTVSRNNIPALVAMIKKEVMKHE